MRTQKAMKNMKIAMLYQMSVLLFNFIDRKLFVHILGVEYLGIHGLFTNMISMLALAELGVGTAIIYNLYAPLARGDEEEVALLMKIYKKLYIGIGAIIGILGLLSAAFLPWLIKETSLEMSYIRSVYLIFVLGTVGTYWTGYKRSLLYADQNKYVLLMGDMGANVLGMLFKAIVLLAMPSYGLYLMVHVLTKIIPNLYIHYKVDRLYPYLKQHQGRIVPDTFFYKIRSNVADLFIHKIDQFVVLCTDNLVISSFVGIAAVGRVTNYSLIIAAIMNFIAQGIDAIEAGMGNLVSTESKEKVHGVYERINFACFFVGSATTVCLIGLIQPFMALWLGNEYVLADEIVAVMVLNYFLWVMTRPVWQMMTVCGLFKPDKRNAVVEMSVNLVVSILLVNTIGIIGVFIGTTLSYSIAWLMKSRLLYQDYFQESGKSYYKNMAMYLGVTLIEGILTMKLCNSIAIENIYIAFIVRMIVCAILPSSMNCILFGRTTHFKYFKDKLEERINIVDRFKNANSLDKWLTMLVTALIFIVPLHSSNLPIGNRIGQCASAAMIGLSGLYILWHAFSKETNPKKVRYTLFAYMGFIIFLVISGLITGGMDGIKVAISIGMVTCTGVACTLIDWSQLNKGILIIDIGIIIWILGLFKGLIEWEYYWASFSYIYENPNFLGIVILVFIIILIIAYSQIRKKRYIIYGVPLLIILLESNGRSSLMAFLLMIIIYIMWNVITKSKKIYTLVGLGILVGLVSIAIIYPLLGTIEAKGRLMIFLREIYDQQPLNGREQLWLDAIALIREKPLFGYGLQATLQNLMQAELNTHNQYLQILLQGGWIGLCGVIGGWTILWSSLLKLKEQLITRIGAGIIGAILVVACFENTLLGESITLGILQWSILGVGISKIIAYKRGC